jgi:transposase
MTKDKDLKVVQIDTLRVPELKNPVLADVHEHIIAVTKFILTDEIENVKRSRGHPTNPTSTRSQKFWNTSDIYRGVCSFAVLAAVKNTSTRISFIAKELSTSLATISRICNQAEEAGYIEQFNKGGNTSSTISIDGEIEYTSATTMRASEWQLGNYIKLFTLWKLKGWSKRRQRYNTIPVYKWYDDLELNPTEFEKIIKSFDKWSHDL